MSRAGPSASNSINATVRNGSPGVGVLYIAAHMESIRSLQAWPESVNDCSSRVCVPGGCPRTPWHVSGSIGSLDSAAAPAALIGPGPDTTGSGASPELVAHAEIKTKKLSSGVKRRDSMADMLFGCIPGGEGDSRSDRSRVAWVG